MLQPATLLPFRNAIAVALEGLTLTRTAPIAAANYIRLHKARFCDRHPHMAVYAFAPQVLMPAPSKRLDP